MKEKMTMKEKLETKACYGQFKTNAVCRKCVYARSCEVYTRTIPGLRGRSGMISFDPSVCEWMAAPPRYTPGYEEDEEEKLEDDDKSEESSQPEGKT